MTTPDPHKISCRDGIAFYVRERHGRIIVEAGWRDRVLQASELARYQAGRDPGELSARFEGMPVETVRAYAKAHGGVSEAGERALALLKRLPSAAAAANEPAPVPEAPPAPEPTPVSEAEPAVEEAAPGRPFPEGRPGRPAPRFPPECRHLVTPPPEAMVSRSTA